jgi:hypothetical protein
MDGTVLRIENSSRVHAESLHRLLRGYQASLVQIDGAWQVEIGLGDVGAFMRQLSDSLGSWLDAEQVDSLVLHLAERQYVLLRRSKERPRDSSAFLLERIVQLETALETRIAIEQAKGILARACGVSPDEAFGVLRKTARDSGTKLRELAERVVASPSEAEAILKNRPD